MGLDVYVGSLSRYHAGNWLTIVQQAARDTGVPVINFVEGEPITVIRADDIEDTAAGPVLKRLNRSRSARKQRKETQQKVIAWRARLSQELQEDISQPLEWDERPDVEYFTDKLGWEPYGQLLLWASYDEHPELPRPHDAVAEFDEDPAYKASSNLSSRYDQFLSGLWLPGGYSFSFEVATITGLETFGGWNQLLLEQLTELNRRTWDASDSMIAEWRWNGVEDGAPLEDQAKYALAVLLELTRQSVAHNLPMILDY